MTDDNPHPVGRAVLESLSAAKEEGRAAERVRNLAKLRFLRDQAGLECSRAALNVAIEAIEGSTDAN